jgi:hypothetical protein
MGCRPRTLHIEPLENRQLLAVIAVTTTNQEVNTDADTSLQEAIFAANFNANIAINPVNLNTFITTSATPGSGADTIVLQAGATYQMSGIVQDQFNQTGPSANPAIFSNITIEANGATLERVGSQDIRAFAVVDLYTNITLPDASVIPAGATGNLTIRNAYIKGFQVHGGNGADGGGGGLGAGAGVYVMDGGRLTLVNCTFEANSATGGDGGADAGTAGGGGGGGLSGDGAGEGIGGDFRGGGGGGGSRGNGGVAGASGGGGGGTANDGVIGGAAIGGNGGFNSGGKGGSVQPEANPTNNGGNGFAQGFALPTSPSVSFKSPMMSIALYLADASYLPSTIDFILSSVHSFSLS